MLVRAAGCSHFLCAKYSRIIIRINALTLVPFLSASAFNSARCFSERNVLILSVLAFSRGDTCPPPFYISTLYVHLTRLSSVICKKLCASSGHIMYIVVLCEKRREDLWGNFLICCLQILDTGTVLI